MKMNEKLKYVQSFDSLSAVLSPKEEQVLRLRYGLDDGTLRTLEEVGRLFNVSKERIRQIEVRALRKLKFSKK